MRWQVELVGESFDLELLASLFTADPLVANGSGGWRLSSSEIEQADASGEAHERARELMPRLNGIARLYDRRHRSVALGSGVIDTLDGSLNAVVVLGAAECRSRVVGGIATGNTAVDPVETPPLDPSSLVRLAANDEVVARVVELLDRTGPDPDRLYRAFERIRDEVGGEAALKKAGMTCDSEMSAFGAWANRPEISGDRARHEVLPGDTPRRAMNDLEAWALLGRLVRQWAAQRADD